jgi:ferredoxin
VSARPTVDRDRCILSGICEMVAAEVFGVDDDGVLQVLVEEVDGDLLVQAKAAATQCPSRALSL